MKSVRRQSGITLVVSLIMLVVLTLLVVSAIRFGNINLKISGNAQTEAEATAATQVAIETMLKEVSTAVKVDEIAAQPTMQVSTGGMTYTVNAAKPVCLLSKNVAATELDPSKASDRPCIEGNDPDRPITADMKLGAVASVCKDQQWDVQATLADATSGAAVTILQGVALRVPAQVKCP
ncbi:MAG: PilX N-terminal domain-containing pilus assembly protein [Ramlibacter sp.]|nr:PilX N-terminal domain-containing pilus assembly protein [Ramlibacter sp.]